MSFPDWSLMTKEQLKHWRNTYLERAHIKEESAQRYRDAAQKIQFEMLRRGIEFSNDD